MITIAIPNYNGRRFLPDCIESVFSQEIDNVEVLVCDDASTDGSVEWLKTNYPEVRLIQNPVNVGLGATRNRLIKYASGDYVFFLDSDDVLAHGALPRMLEEISGYDAVMGKASSFVDGSSVFETGNRHHYINEEIDALRKNPSLVRLAQLSVASGRLISVDYLRRNNIRFSESRFMEDALFGLLFALPSPRIKFIDDLVIYVREHSQSLTASINEEKVLCVIEDTKEMIECTRGYPQWLRLRLDGNALVYFLHRNNLCHLDVVIRNKTIFNHRERILIGLKLLKLTRNIKCLRLL